jgi:hypothetical protein
LLFSALGSYKSAKISHFIWAGDRDSALGSGGGGGGREMDWEDVDLHALYDQVLEDIHKQSVVGLCESLLKEIEEFRDLMQQAERFFWTQARKQPQGTRAQ